MNIHDDIDECENTPVDISLTIRDGCISVTCIVRRMAFDEDGAVVDSSYQLNPGVNCDEELLRLLKDTLKGMGVELDHQLLKNRMKEES